MATIQTGWSDGKSGYGALLSNKEGDQYFSLPISTINSVLNSGLPNPCKITNITIYASLTAESSISTSFTFAVGYGGSGNITQQLNSTSTGSGISGLSASISASLNAVINGRQLSTSKGSYITFRVYSSKGGKRTCNVKNVYLDVSYSTPLTVTVSRGTGCASVSGGGSYYYGDSATVSATGETGYKWGSWDNGSTYNSYTFTVTNNVSLTANFTPITYYISYSANGGSGTIATQTCTYGSSYNISDCTFTEPGVTVTFERNGGMCNIATMTVKKSFLYWKDKNSNATYTPGQQISNLKTTDNTTLELIAVWSAADVPLVPAERAGYNFLGWLYNGNIYTDDESLILTENVTVVAQWEKIKGVFVGNKPATVYVGNTIVKEIYVGMNRIY